MTFTTIPQAPVLDWTASGTDGRMGMSVIFLDVESPGLGPLRSASAGWALNSQSLANLRELTTRTRNESDHAIGL